MKKYIQYNKVILVLLLVIASYQFTNAQISNGGINYELRVDQFYQETDNDGATNDDHQWRIGINSDANTGGSTSWPSTGPGGGCAANNYGYRWQADAPSNSGANLNILLYTGTNRSGTSTFNIAGESWEEDGGWDCSSSGDAGAWIGNYTVSFNTATKTPALWWGPDDVAGGEWVSEDWTVTSGTRRGDARIKTAWRYTYGYDCSNPLDFGTITVGAAAKTHLNTNRVVPTGGSANVGYANVAGNTAPDVYYTFTITTDATVVISTVSGSTNYDSYLRLYNSDCSNQLAFNDDFSGLQAQITQYLCAGTYRILVEGTGGTPTGNFLLSVSANTTTPAVPVSPVAGTFGTNQWYVYGYNGGNLDLTGSTYKGYYTETALSYYTSTKWNTLLSPSYAPGWNGNCVNIDNHVVVSKREGFPCNIYTISMPTNDDDARLYVNGALITSGVCCNTLTGNLWTGYLSSTSTVEIRHIDGSGGSEHAVNLANVTTTLNGGTIAGIANNVNVCQGTDPGAFTSSVNASGGTIGITNGSPAAHVYLWQRATDVGFTTGLTSVGTNSNVYDPDNSLTGGTYYFRRRVTDACGTIAYSNTIQVNIIHNITSTPPTATAASGGTCTQWRANWNAVTGATSYQLDVATDAGFTSMVINNLNVGNVTSYDLNLPLGTYHYRVRAVNSCFTSSNSGTISFTLANVANNDLYKNAIDITTNIAGGATYNGSFNNSGYGLESGEPRPRDVYASAWYKFTTPAGGFTSLNAYVVTSDNSVVTIFRSNGSACPFGNLTNLGDDYECAGSGGVSVTTNCLPGNTTYYMQFGSTNCFLDDATQGSFSITVTPGSVASPDAICNAITLGGATLDPGEAVNNTVVNNTCASREAGEPEGSVLSTVWYKFVTPAAGLESVDFHLGENGGGSDNPAIVAYRSTGGCTFGSLTKVGEDIPGLGTDANSDFTVNCLAPSTTYYIQCGYNDRTLDAGSAGVFDLDISASGNAPAPDDICNALQIGPVGGINRNTFAETPSRLSNLCATVNTGAHNDPANADANEATNWFTFNTPSLANTPADYYIEVRDPNGFPLLGGIEIEVYKLNTTACQTTPGLIYVGSHDPGGCDDEGGANFCLDPASTYYIMIDAEGNSACIASDRGQYKVRVTGNDRPKMADICSDAISLGTLVAGTTIGNSSGSSKWNNFCASTSGDPNPNWTLLGVGTDPYQTVWFKFTTDATSGRSITIEGYNDPGGHGDQIDLKLALYSGSCGSMTLVEKDYDTPPYSETMEGSYCLLPNTTYHILVSGSNIEPITGSSREGYFGLTVRDNGPYPANDLICGATAIAPTMAYTYNSVILSPQNNTKGTYCHEPNPDWAGELLQDNDHAIWYYVGQVPGRTMVVDANNLGTAGDDINLQLALYSSTTAKGACVTPASSPVLTERQKDNNVISNDEDAYYTCLDPNLFYWIMVDGSGGVTGLLSGFEEGPFSLRAWFPEEGETNACNAENLGAIPATGSLIVRNLSNICGTSSITNFPAPSSWGFDKAVVYRFTTPPAGSFTDASIKIEAFTNPYYDESTYATPGGGGGPGGNMDMLENAFNSGDDIDLQLAVYSAGACGIAHTPLGSNYDPTLGSGVDITGASGSDESLIVNCLLPSTEYYLVVDGGTNTNGFYDIKMSNYNIHTTNDFLYQAIDITGTNVAPWTNCNSNHTVTLTGQNNYCATNINDMPSYLPAPFRPSTWNELNSVVWYKFKAPKSGKLEIRAKNSIADLITPFDEPEINIQLAVFELPGGYQGALDASTLIANKNRLILIASDYDALSHDEDFTVECLKADTIYYLAVDGSTVLACPTCQRGEFYLELQADPRDRPATNDALCDAIDLGTPVLSTTIVDTKVPPASGAATNPSPSTGYPTTTGLHNGVRNNANSCMRAENNFCAGTANEPGVSGGTFLTDFSPDATVWYSFTAPLTGEVIIDAFNDPSPGLGDQIDLQLAVYESSDGTCSGTMVPIKAEYNIGSFSETMQVQCLNPGQKYWILVDGSGLNTYGYFELQVQAVTATLSAPANDDICFATTVTYPASIGATTTLNNQTNRCATIQTIYSEPTTFTKDADVWYKFTTPNTVAPHAVEVTVTSGLPWPFGDAMDPQIALYKMNPTTGPCASSFTLVDDDYSALGLPFIETFEFHCLEQNTTYYLMVDGSGLNEQGNFKLDVKRITPHPLAGNDNICSVTTVGTGSLGTLGATTGNKVGNTTTDWHNFCSSVEVGEPALMSDGNYTLDQTVWFKFRTPNTANNIDVEIRALNDPNNVGDQIDLQMLLVQGGTCSPFTGLTPIESVDPVLSFSATMRVCLPPNTDFYINVDGSGLNKQGYFTIEVENMGLTSAPSNDNICSAKVLPSGGTITGSYTGYLNDNNNCATLENFEKQQAAGSIQRSVWYKFTAPTSADVSIEVIGNSFVPFTTNYFLPDVTIWELSDNSYASIDNTIAGCPAPSAVQWNQLEYNDYQVIPNSLANGLYPTVVLTPLCLKPGYTYYVQVDGVAGVGLDGFFDIRIRNNQVPFTQPANNEAAAATVVPISSASCQLSNGTWQSAGGYSFGNNPTWSNPNTIGIPTSAGIPSCTQNCGDVWYKFQVPAACGNNTKSFIKIEGDDEFNFTALEGYPELAIAAYSGPSSGATTSLTYLKCSIGGTGVDPDFSIAANPGEWIYLQIWDLAGNEQGKTFKLCVSEQKSADDCADATNMTLDIPYCFSVESHTGETPNGAVPGSGLNTCFGSGIPQHSSYFKFTTDAAATFCDDYYIYLNTAALARDLSNVTVNNACVSAAPSVNFNLSLYQLVGTPCTPGAGNAVLSNCQTFNDCGGGSIGSNVVGPHGNGGILQDTIWYNLATGTTLLPNTTYYIVLDYDIVNPIYTGRVVLDGVIEVGRRCKGRTWEYSTAPLVTTSNYCESRDGWQHYYDDKGTPATGDDRYVFSIFPNGNNIKGTAKVYLNNNFYSYIDIPNRYAEYVMRRRWDFVMTSGFNTIDPAKPVKVRFYYQNSEKQEIITAAQTFATNYGVFYEDFEWFKSANGQEFNVATDVNPRVISIGPNGYSETGCLSYWDASGTYVGPPGIARCSTKVITDWDDNNAYHQWCNGIHFCEYNGLTGFSGGTGGTGDSPWDVSPLPVELTSFTGYNVGNKNVLNWTTASELNTLKFEVERSTSNSSAFTYIGEKPAAGNSSQVLNYSLDDLAPLEGNNYYRLKIIDTDGTFEYSQTIMINISGTIEYNDVITKVFPNPTNNILYIDYQAASNSTITLKVFDAIGQEMTASKATVVKGNQLLKLDASTFADGVYIIHIQDANSGKILQSKFIKD